MFGFLKRRHLRTEEREQAIRQKLFAEAQEQAMKEAAKKSQEEWEKKQNEKSPKK